MGVPFGKKLKYKTDPKNMATVLENLNFKNVRKSNNFDFSGSKPIKATFQTFDGLRIDLLMIENVVPATVEGEEDAYSFWATFEAVGAGAEALIKARQITEQTKGWAFELPAYKASRLNKRLKDIIEDIKVGS